MKRIIELGKDAALFARVLATGRSDALDYTKTAPRMTIDRRTRLWRRADLRFQLAWNGKGVCASIGVNDTREMSLEEFNALRADADRLEDALSEWISAIFAEIIGHVHAEYDYQTSPDEFLEAAEMNDWWFTDAGLLVTPPEEG